MHANFIKYLKKDHILKLQGTTKREVLNELLKAAAESSSISKDIMEKAVWQREKMMTTGLGQGLALPHIRHSELSEPILFIGICENEISDYLAIDSKPVRIIVFLIAPEGDQENYLKLLGGISSKFKDEEIIQQVISFCGKPAKIAALLKKQK